MLANMASLPKFLFFIIFNIFLPTTFSADDDSFEFNGFQSTSLRLDGVAYVSSSGLLYLTDAVRQTMGHAFYPKPVDLKSTSFSATFAFAMVSHYEGVNGCGLAFVVSATNNFSSALPNQYIGLFNKQSNGNSTDRVLAIELDTVLNPEFKDIDGNHVGVDINSLISVDSRPAAYWDATTGVLKNLSLNSGEAMQVWVDFIAHTSVINVTMSPLGTPKPVIPLLSTKVDLSDIVSDTMYVGFSSGTGSFYTSHCLLGWSFSTSGPAAALDYSKLPPVPKFKTGGRSRKLVIWVTLASSFVALLVASAVIFVVRRRIKYAEVLEDWEKEYGPHRFTYKELYDATNGFREKELLGIGGFGRVYHGVLPKSKISVAVKRVSHESKQGMREFVAEIVSIGQLRHRNIVQLLGYCRRKGELLLVYDYMPNGSLDKLLHEENAVGTLNWAQRFQIIKGVAAGLLYLHEDWEQVVLHRDIKASNVLLDSELNGRIGDFGLARLYERGADPQTTHIVGTMGYIAPELSKTGKSTKETDVFAFGAFLHEVVCGRRPIEPQSEQLVLVDWVLESWKNESLMTTRDPRLVEFEQGEVEMVMKLGLLCSHPVPAARPSMRQVVQFLDGDAEFPELSPAYLNFSMLSLMENEGFDDYIMSFPSTTTTFSTAT